jgi:hypothetical protein
MRLNIRTKVNTVIFLVIYTFVSVDHGTRFRAIWKYRASPNTSYLLLPRNCYGNTSLVSVPPHKVTTGEGAGGSDVFIALGWVLYNVDFDVDGLWGRVRIVGALKISVVLSTNLRGWSGLQFIWRGIYIGLTSNVTVFKFTSLSSETGACVQTQCYFLQIHLTHL